MEPQSTGGRPVGRALPLLQCRSSLVMLRNQVSGVSPLGVGVSLSETSSEDTCTLVTIVSITHRMVFPATAVPAQRPLPQVAGLLATLCLTLSREDFDFLKREIRDLKMFLDGFLRENLNLST